MLAGFLCRGRKINYTHSDVFLKCLLFAWIHGNVMRVSRRRIKVSLITSLKNVNWKWNLSSRRNQQCLRRTSLVLSCLWRHRHELCWPRIHVLQEFWASALFCVFHLILAEISSNICCVVKKTKPHIKLNLILGIAPRMQVFTYQYLLACW